MSTNFEDLIMRNTRANQPAFGVPGRLYFVTDELVMERDSGAAWESVSSSPSGTNYARVVIVAKSGGDYSTIQDAIDSIVDAATDKRYLVWVMPGLYAEQVTMQAWVDVRGVSKHDVQIQYASASGAVILADSVQLEDILIETTATATDFAIVGTNVSNWHVRNVDILTPSPFTNRSQGLKVTGATWATGFIEHGVWNIHSQTGYGLYLTGDGGNIDMTVNDLFLDCFSATTGGCINLDNVADIQIRSSFFRTSANGYNLLTATGGSVDIIDSFFEFGDSSIEVGASTTVRSYGCFASSWVNSGTLQGSLFDLDAYYHEVFGAGGQMRFWGTAGGGSEGITYLDAGSTQRFGLFFPGADVVALGNRASNGVVQLRANTSTAGSGGEITVAEIQDDRIHLLDPDVAHGMTTQTPTTVYGKLDTTSGTEGGLRITGLNEVTIGLNLHGYGVTDNTTRSTAGLAYVNVNAAKKSGTDVGACGANAGLLAVRDNGATRAIIDAEGDLHLDATSNINVWDDYNDVALLAGLKASLLPDGHEMKRKFAEWIEYARPILEQTGVVTYNEDGHHFIAMQRMNMLLIDALGQMYQKVNELEERLDKRDKRDK